MKLTQIMKGIDYKVLSGSDDVEISDIIYNSKNMKPGTVFVCLKGAKFDSHTLAADMARAGAAAIIVEHEVEAPGAAVLKVDDSRRSLGYMAANYFRHPADELKKIGVTGSKGKTTTCYMIKAILEAAGHKTGLIGSIGALSGDTPKDPGGHTTTPESYEIHRLFREMADEGCEYVVMETSSQAFKMKRTAGITYDCGIFLDISRDHISPWEHATLEEYLQCKAVLMKTSVHGIVNFDDPHLDQILEGNHLKSRQSFGFKDGADVVIKNYTPVNKKDYKGIEYDTEGAVAFHMICGSPGRFSAYDSCAAALCCHYFGIEKNIIEHALSHIKIRGRVEKVDIDAPYSVILDFAHDGIGISNLISAVKDYRPNHIIAVFGSDGNRTKIRRADAGEILGNSVDYTIVTSNSPRFEPVEEINKEIILGLDRTKGKYEEIIDRRTAIKTAMKMAEAGDVILLIGKGHWVTEEIMGVDYPFDERVVVKELWQEIQEER